MKRWKTSFTQSFQELKDLRNLAAVSILLAHHSGNGFYRLQITGICGSDSTRWQKN